MSDNGKGDRRRAALVPAARVADIYCGLYGVRCDTCRAIAGATPPPGWVRVGVGWSCPDCQAAGENSND
jgi:hypothetical protein